MLEDAAVTGTCGGVVGAVSKVRISLYKSGEVGGGVCTLAADNCRLGVVGPPDRDLPITGLMDEVFIEASLSVPQSLEKNVVELRRELIAATASR